MAESGNSRISTRTYDAFLELLRSGLWGYAADVKYFDKQTDWQSVYRLSKMQTVTGLVFDGLTTLPKDLQPSAELFKKWYVYTVKIEQSHKLLNEVLAEIYTLYCNKGFTPVLLKGQGIAQCYHNPMHRQCGDIDLYIGVENYEGASQLVESMGLIDKHASESEKHLHFNYKGVVIENHRIVSELFNKIAGKYFTEMVNKEFPDNVRIVQVGEKNIMLPSVNFDSVFILVHASNHFFGGGIGIRQLCDWVRLLHKYKDEINHVRIKTDIEGLKLEQIWRVFGCIAINYLGLPESEMPFYNPKYTNKAKQALNIIMKEGNFGFASNKGIRPKGYLSGKLHSFKYSVKRLFGIYSVFPKNTIDYLLYYFKKGVDQIIKDKF